MILEKKSMHFVGIGGIGMSSIASILLSMGYDISGSDVELNGLTEKLKKAGARIFKGHDGANISSGTGIVVYSSSINSENPEIAEARRRDIPIVKRAGARRAA